MCACWSNGQSLKTKPWLGWASRPFGWAVFGLMVLAASAAGAANAPADSTQTVYLQPQELGTRIKGYQLDITPQTFPFPKLPRQLHPRLDARVTKNPLDDRYLLFKV